MRRAGGFLRETGDLFWTIRSCRRQTDHYQNNNKQRYQYERDQYEQDPLKYEHTAISHFLQWHSAEGARVPAFQRKGERSLSAVFQARAGLA